MNTNSPLTFGKFKNWTPAELAQAGTSGRQYLSWGANNLKSPQWQGAFRAAPIASGAAVALISDGEPDDEAAALAAARRFPAAVNVFYCGPEGGPGQDFLRRLAQATGGQYQPVSLAPAQALPALRRVLSLPVPK